MLLFVKVTDKGPQPLLTLDVKLAIGNGKTVSVCEVWLKKKKTLVAVKLIVGVKTEAVEFTNVKLGLVAVEVAVGVTPKFQR